MLLLCQYALLPDNAEISRCRTFFRVGQEDALHKNYGEYLRIGQGV